MGEISWQAPEFEYREKTVSWYWFSIILAVLVLAVAIWQKNFLFAVFVILAEILILVWANREPTTIEYRLNEKGLDIGKNKSYTYGEIESFGMREYSGEEWSELVFTFKKSLRPPLKASLPTHLLPQVKKALEAILRETEIKESAFDALERFLRF